MKHEPTLLTCTIKVAIMLLALMSPGIPRYWIPFLEKIVAPASNQGTWLVPFRSSGTTHPAAVEKPLHMHEPLLDIVQEK